MTQHYWVFLAARHWVLLGNKFYAIEALEQQYPTLKEKQFNPTSDKKELSLPNFFTI